MGTITTITSFFHTTYEWIDAHLREHTDGIGFSAIRPRSNSADRASCKTRCSTGCTTRPWSLSVASTDPSRFACKSAHFRVEPRGRPLTSAVQKLIGIF